MNHKELLDKAMAQYEKNMAQKMSKDMEQWRRELYGMIAVRPGEDAYADLMAEHIKCKTTSKIIVEIPSAAEIEAYPKDRYFIVAGTWFLDHVEAVGRARQIVVLRNSHPGRG